MRSEAAVEVSSAPRVLDRHDEVVLAVLQRGEDQILVERPVAVGLPVLVDAFAVVRVDLDAVQPDVDRVVVVAEPVELVAVLHGVDGVNIEALVEHQTVVGAGPAFRAAAHRSRARRPAGGRRRVGHEVRMRRDVVRHFVGLKVTARRAAVRLAVAVDVRCVEHGVLPVSALVDVGDVLLRGARLVRDVGVEFTSAPRVLDGDRDVVLALVQEILEFLLLALVGLDEVVAAVPVLRRQVAVEDEVRLASARFVTLKVL